MIPTSTDISVDVKPKYAPNFDAVVVFVTQEAKHVDAPALSAEDRKAAQRVLSAGVVRGNAKEIGFDLIERGKRHRRVFVVGLGPAEKVTAESIRQAAGIALKAARKHRARSLAVVLPKSRVSAPDAAEAVTTGVMLAGFDFREYKGKAKQDQPEKQEPLDVTIVSSDADARSVREAVDRARAVAEGQNFARTIASRPGNTINPPALARVAQEMCRELKLKCRVLDEKEMARLGMGGILAVGAGSSRTPPRMIVIEYRPPVGATPASPKGSARGRATQASPLLVVGKAITFDTGGISIKPAEKMGKMIFDKSGGMAVLGLMAALARIKPPIRVVGILSSAENHISETAYRPGDILRMYNGVTVEVTNTDAEGRLVLGDALAWGCETYKPAAVIDLATLTGGCVVALGNTIAGLMSNNDDLAREVQSSAEAVGEKVWRLPLPDEVREMIKSDPADIVNSAGRYASPLQGGMFLSHFVPEKTPWVHLDIAGVADTEKEMPYYAKGSTGWGVRTLVEWVMRRAGVATASGDVRETRSGLAAASQATPSRQPAPDRRRGIER